VPSKTRIRLEEDGADLETVYIGGRKSSIQLRIYNKSEELAANGGKDWLWTIWGIEPTPGVWRVEFQLRRAVLKQFSVRSISDLTDRLSGLWDYLTNKWVSFRLQDNENATRRTVHPWWLAVAKSGSLLSGGTAAKRSYLRTAMPAEWYVAHISGCLAGFAARQGLKNLGDVLHQLLDRIRTYWASRDFEGEYRIRCLQLGLDPDAEVQA